MGHVDPGVCLAVTSVAVCLVANTAAENVGGLGRVKAVAACCKADEATHVDKRSFGIVGICS